LIDVQFYLEHFILVDSKSIGNNTKC